MTVPQPFRYQGSEQALAPLILKYLPISTTRLVEPFDGFVPVGVAQPSPAASPGTLLVPVSGAGDGTPRQPAGETPALRREVFQLSAARLPVW